MVEPMKRLCVLVSLLLCASPPTLIGQQLADVVKQEEARRKAVTKQGKVYTNQDLEPDFTAGVPPAADPAPSPAPRSASPVAPTDDPAAATDAPGDEANDEGYWRSRSMSARAGLERSRIFAETLEKRLDALATDLARRDDSAQRDAFETERLRLEALLERAVADVAAQTRAVTELEQEAREAGVPPEWLRQ
jgi:hypothetical protein